MYNFFTIMFGVKKGHRYGMKKFSLQWAKVKSISLS